MVSCAADPRSRSFRVPAAGLVCCAVVLAGCVTPIQQPSITTAGPPRITTFGIDARDYQNAAGRLGQSILTDARLSLDGKQILALGPVTDDDCLYRFDARTFQEKLQTILHRADRLQVSFVIDAMKGNNAAQARYDIMRLQWEKENAVAPEDLRTFGKLANVDYLLFGRVASLQSTKSGQTEVTYAYNWKLGDCATGLIAWTDETGKTKSGQTPRTPEWVTDPRGDSATYVYEATSADGKTADAAIAHARQKAQGQFAARLNAQLPAEDGLIVPLRAEAIDAEIVPQGRFSVESRGGARAWVLLRYPRASVRTAVATRERALSLWKAALQSDASADYRSLITAFPLGAQDAFRTERACLALADRERAANHLLAANRLYQQVHDHSTSATDRANAAGQLLVVDLSAEERLLREAFEGKNLHVLAAYESNGKAVGWPKMHDELTRFVHSKGGDVTVPAAPPGAAATVRKSMLDDAQLKLPAGADALLLAVASGKISDRESATTPLGKEHQFAGEIRCVVLRRDAKKVFADRYSGAGGWNPIGAGICMDVLALNVMQRWRKNFLVYLGSTHE